MINRLATSYNIARQTFFACYKDKSSSFTYCVLFSVIAQYISSDSAKNYKTRLLQLIDKFYN